LDEVTQAGSYIGFARGAWLGDHSIEELKPPVQAIREAAELVQHILSGGAGYNGRIFQLASHVKAPYPLPDARIPILIGTWGKKLCAVAGEIADEVKVGGSANPDIVPVIQEYIAVGEREAKRDIGTVGVVIGAVSVIDEDRDQARQEARRSVALYLPVVAGLDPTVNVDPEQMARIQRHVELEELDQAAALISDDLLERFAFAGNAEDIINHCERLFAAGTQRIEFGTPHGLQSETGIRILGEKVLPALAQWRTQ
jgi:5,10-methylenetetrahydromethanopterin reductase